MSDAPIWTGELRRGEVEGTVTGTLVDAWGWRIVFTGTQQPDRSYALTATVEVPEALRVAGIDDA